MFNQAVGRRFYCGPREPFLGCVSLRLHLNGIAVQKIVTFQSRASNCSPNRTPGNHCGVNQILPARRRLAQLLGPANGN
jgi:hypothetical protein